MNTGKPETSVKVDLAIFGGGIAGLWLLALARKAGFNAILLESEQLGAGQTRCAQGIIHGGTKYALTGKLSSAADKVSRMPKLWLDCISGKGELDLSKVKILSSHQYMWSTSGIGSRLSGFFASRAMHSRTQEVKHEQRPPVFQAAAFKGQVYQLNEPVLDAMSIVQTLAEPHTQSIAKLEGVPTFDTAVAGNFCFSNGGQQFCISANQVILAAGKGNAALLQALGRQSPRMQLRPLKMVMLRGDLPVLYAHCLGASVNPRITITSHFDVHGNTVWYVGGQLAENGPAMSDEQLIADAKKELQQVFSWLDFSSVQWACLSIDRAEPETSDGKRPDTVFAQQENTVITAWPTKLALAPVLAAEVMELLRQLNIRPSGLVPLPQWQHPQMAKLPWQESNRWD
ncbi:MAG: FAD-dependent oxidoreductase [Gammaproteobacteria bacterium]|nr:FAD-dependent oxidoreductase [Gammaproteobacteria bacterium]MDH5801751.1 FAD-dependent oxidoreductase [Gammaproteobacteria bacterium]